MIATLRSQVMYTMSLHGVWSIAGGLAALVHDISKVAGIAGNTENLPRFYYLEPSNGPCQPGR